MPRILVACLSIGLLCALISARSRYASEESEADSDEPFDRRASSGFTNAQRKMQEQMLKEHNAYRALHCTPPLELDDELSRSAQEYAQKLAKSNNFDHSDMEELGENLFKMESNYPIEDLVEPTTQATKGWYDEIRHYNFRKPKFSDAVGHLTQLLWKESTKMGVGYAVGKSGHEHALYIVVHYSPGGNVHGYFRENVLPKC